MIKHIVLLIIFSLFVYSCNKENNKADNKQSDAEKSNPDSVLLDQSPVVHLPVINYKLIKSKSYSALLKEYDTTGVKIILALNRVDKNRVKRLDSLVVPDTILSDLNLYSPFPQRIDLLEKVKKIIIISQSHQAFAIYEFGNLVKWGPASTGKKSTPTPNGLFATNWKSKKTISTDNSDWILKWYLNLENFSGVSIHEYELPGYPASHACARLLAEDSKWIYYWAEQWILTDDGENIIAYGTPVIIYGEYDFKKGKTWRLLPTDPEKAKVNVEELESEIEKHIITILTRQDERDKLLAVNTDSTLIKN